MRVNKPNHCYPCRLHERAGGWEETKAGDSSQSNKDKVTVYSIHEKNKHRYGQQAGGPSDLWLNRETDSARTGAQIASWKCICFTMVQWYRLSHYSIPMQMMRDSIHKNLHFNFVVTISQLVLPQSHKKRMGYGCNYDHIHYWLICWLAFWLKRKCRNFTHQSLCKGLGEYHCTWKSGMGKKCACFVRPSPKTPGFSLTSETKTNIHK